MMVHGYSQIPGPGASCRSTQLVNPSASRYHKPRLPWPAFFFIYLYLACRAAASVPDLPQISETLAVDPRVPHREKGSWVVLSPEEHEKRELRERSTSVPTVTTTFEVAVSTVTEGSTTSTAAASPLPSPLDSSLSSNFSGNTGDMPCPSFINSFLTNPTFKKCYPLSLLLQGSRSFFEAEKSLVGITRVLDASCSADVSFCSSYMTSLANNLTEKANCGTDFELGNSVVVQTYIAMVSYQTLYSATCLKDPSSSSYCYANAVTNLTTPSNAYFYYLPLNISLPGSAMPSCTWCLDQTMAIYQASTVNRKLPIANTYVSAAQQVNTLCGPDFVNETLPQAIVLNAANSNFVTIPWLSIILTFALATWPLL